MASIISQIAWDDCSFCSKGSMEIARMIVDPERWNEIPVQYKCAWDRVCQVGFGRFGRKKIWQELCRYRSEINNAPSPDPYKQSEWLESTCSSYREAKRKTGL